MPAERFDFEDFELDWSAYELRRAGTVIRLERIPLELLLLNCFPSNSCLRFLRRCVRHNGLWLYSAI